MAEIVISRFDSTLSSHPYSETVESGAVVVTPLYQGLINTTRMIIGDRTLDLGRRITQIGKEEHGLDKSMLLWLGTKETQKDYSTAFEFKVPGLHPNIVNWEDPRHIVVGDKALIGVTAVSRMRGLGGRINFHPAFIWAKIDESGNFVGERTINLWQLFQGRNVTPISVDVNGDITFVARVEDKRRMKPNGSIHTLSYYVLSKDGKLRLDHELEIPTKEWGSHKYGTVGVPIPWGEDGQQLMLIHGQNVYERPTRYGPKKTTRYSIGAILLDKNGNIIAMTDKPLLGREMYMFTQEIRGENETLYSVDNLRDLGNEFSLLVNAGDSTTQETIISKSYIESTLKVLPQPVLVTRPGSRRRMVA